MATSHNGCPSFQDLEAGIPWLLAVSWKAKKIMESNWAIKKGPWLFRVIYSFIGDYTTQLYRDYDKPMITAQLTSSRHKLEMLRNPGNKYGTLIRFEFQILWGFLNKDMFHPYKLDRTATKPKWSVWRCFGNYNVELAGYLEVLEGKTMLHKSSRSQNKMKWPAQTPAPWKDLQYLISIFYYKKLLRLLVGGHLFSLDMFKNQDSYPIKLNSLTHASPKSLPPKKKKNQFNNQKPP